MRTCTIRRFSAGDTLTVVDLADELRLSHWSRQDYQDELARRDSRMLIADCEGSIGGFIVGRIVPGSTEGELDAEIYNIGVSKAHQRMGIGAALINEFLRLCQASSVKTVWLEVRSANAAAIAFYEGAGFSVISVRPRFYQDPEDDALVMQWGA